MDRLLTIIIALSISLLIIISFILIHRRGCPDGTCNRITGGGESNIKGCNCPLNQLWIDNKCKACPGVTTTLKMGSDSSMPGCYCPVDIPEWANNRCGVCSNGTIWSAVNRKCIPEVDCPVGTSIDGRGGESNIVGCYCPATTPKWSGTTCGQCTDGTTWSVDGKTCVQNTTSPPPTTLPF